MKRIITTTLMALLLCLTMALGLASCDIFTQDDINSHSEQIAALEAAIADKDTKIAALEAGKADLEKDKATLEAEKAALEAEKAELEAEKAALQAEKAELEEKNNALEIDIVCASGRHFYDLESEVEYAWDTNLMTCSASFICSVCEETAVVSASNITTNDDGVRVATFEGGISEDTIGIPFFTGVSFNSDSEAYDEATNTFSLTSGNPLVITFEGKNLDKISSTNEYGLAVGTGINLYLFDYISNSDYGIISVTDTTVTVTVDSDKIFWDSDNYGYISRFAIFDLDPETLCEATLIEINVRFEGDTYMPTTDAEGYTLVSNAKELEIALSNSKKIRFAADIESVDGFIVQNNVAIDLAGYDLTVTDKTQHSFWIYSDCEIFDSVGGSHLALGITVNLGSLKFSDSITVSENEHIGIFTDCSLDLSDYTGDELFIYVSETAEGVILPEGYSFYDANGIMETAIYHTYVRPTEQRPDSE